MAKNVGKYAVILSADARPLAAAAQQARQLMAQVGKGAGEVARQAAGAVKSVGLIGGVATAVAAAAPVAWLRSMANGLEQADRQARKLGVSIGELRGLHLAGGAAAQEMAQAVGGLNLNLAKSAQGDLAARDLFAGVGGPGGITGGPEGLATVLDRLQAIPSEAARAAQAFRVLGDAAGELLPFLGEGGGGVRAAQDQARRFGLFVGENDLKTAKEVAGVFREIGALWQGAQNQFALAIAPFVAELRSMVDLSGLDISGWSGMIRDGIKEAGTVAAGLMDTLGDAQFWSQLVAYAKQFGAVLLEGVAEVVAALPSITQTLATQVLGPKGYARLVKAGVLAEAAGVPGVTGLLTGAGSPVADALRERAGKMSGDAAAARAAFAAARAAGGPGRFERGWLSFAGAVDARAGGNTAGPGAMGWGGVNVQAQLAPFVKEVVNQFNQALGGLNGADPARAFRQAMNDISTFKDFGLFMGMPGAEGKMAFEAFQKLQSSVQLPGLQGAPAAALANSASAYSAVLNHERMNRNSNVQDMMKMLLEEANRQRERQVQLSEELLRAWDRRDEIEVRNF